MAQITAALVKALRDKTGLPMMDCKKALTEVAGDENAAIDLLRKKAKGKLETRSLRETSQGRIGLFMNEDHTRGGLVELRCESAQVALTEMFIALADGIAAAVAAGSDAEPKPETVLTLTVEGGKTVQDLIADSFAKLQENTKLIRCRQITGACLAGYVHFDGTTAVLLALDAVPGDPKIGTDLCQHAAFTRPMAISAEQIPPADLEKIGKAARELAVEEGKPEPIIEKIVEGKIRAFCKQNALLDQEHVKPDYEKKSVQAVLKAAGVGTVTDLAVFQVGGA